MHGQICLSITWYLSWLHWEYWAWRWWHVMQHSCNVTEYLYSFLPCRGIRERYGLNVGHTYGMSWTPGACAVRFDWEDVILELWQRWRGSVILMCASRTSRSVCRSSSGPVDLGQWKAGRGGDGWRRGGSSVTVSNALTDWCLISHAVCIHSPPPLSVPKPCLPS